MDAVQAQLEKLKKKYGRELPEKVARLEAALAPLLAGPWEEPISMNAYRQMHSLAGSSGTYGYLDFSKLARSGEAVLKQCLESRALLSEPQKSQVNEVVSHLRELAAAAARDSA